MGRQALKETAVIVAEETGDEDYPFDFVVDFIVEPDYDGLCRPPEMPTGKTNTDS